MEFETAPGALPAGRRVYAIGDVHGCDDRLAALHATIAEDLAQRPCAAPLLLHLGDYVDRGPDSRGVVARLIGGRRVAGGRDGEPDGQSRTDHAGRARRRGRGDDRLDDQRRRGGAAVELGRRSGGAAGDLAGHARCRPEHMRFPKMHGLALMHREGGYLFVHAGIRPGVAIAEQTRQDLLSIRQAFLYSEADFGVVVVHGHTPKEDPGVRRQPDRHRYRRGVWRSLDLCGAGGRSGRLSVRMNKRGGSKCAV